MASTLLRSSARRGSAFRRVVSAAADVTPSGGEGLAVRRTVTLPPNPFRSLLCSGVQGDRPPMSPDEKVDQMLQQVKEIDEQLERDLTEVLKQYKDALRPRDRGYFERFLTRCKVEKTKFRDDFVRCCELTTLFGLSIMVGSVLADWL
ncbi:unnamed protein product [Urochloa decumbens]|uniref:Uncharacterized protein n=1 Tax=Urochloa decumbens TaxID=240449 RepID=A0ABC8YME1_9POAL